MAKIHFTKMHGLGNDYIYINMVRQQAGADEQQVPENADWSALARRWSDRHTGIGSDGIVLIMPSETCDFRMRIFNADGSEAQMCGNAARCIARYVYERGLIRKTDLTLETLAGVKTLHLILAGDKVQSVQVDMGKPLNIKDLHLSVHGRDIDLTAVNMGNPHAVLFYDTLDGVPVEQLGPMIECAPPFPERTNVEFAAIANPREISMRVWERGSGETMACGTGACATAVAAIHRHLTDREATVHLRGGDLQIALDDNGHVLMTGTADFAFDGEIEL